MEPTWLNLIYLVLACVAITLVFRFSKFVAKILVIGLFIWLLITYFVGGDLVGLL